MKKGLLLSVAFVALFATSAQAQNTRGYRNAGYQDKSSVYAVGRFALSFTDGTAKDEDGAKYGDFDVGNGGLDVGVGIKLNDLFRAEVTYNYRGGGENEKTVYGSYYESQKYNVTSSAFMLNGYIDVPVSSQIKPYIGAGVGFADVEYSVKYEGTGKGKAKDSSTEFSYNFAAGIGLEMNKQVTWDIGYRYVDFGSFKKDGLKFETSANEILLGVRYSF